MDRISKTQVRSYAEAINERLGTDFNIDHAYQGFKVESHGGSRDRSTRSGAREAYNWLTAYESGWQDGTHDNVRNSDRLALVIDNDKYLLRIALAYAHGALENRERQKSHFAGLEYFINRAGDDFAIAIKDIIEGDSGASPVVVQALASILIYVGVESINWHHLMAHYVVKAREGVTA